MAVFRDTTVSRRALCAASTLAAVLPFAPDAAPSRSPSPVHRQTRRVAELYEAENVACGLYSEAEGGEDEFAARSAVQSAFDQWDIAARALARMPAADLDDFLAKLAVVFRNTMDGGSAPERLIAHSLLHDLWRLAPAHRDLLRWSPARPEPQA